MTNIYIEARLRWEQQQKEHFGCNYVDGVCTVHGGADAKSKAEPPQPAAQGQQLTFGAFVRESGADALPVSDPPEPEPAASEPAASIELPMTCTCRSFDGPHDVARHAELDSPWDWRTETERASEREAAKAKKLEQSKKAS